jgi:hypothetical protein
MERLEAEAKIIARLMDAVAILQEYDPKSRCLSLTYNGDEQFVNGYNEAFRKDVRPISFTTDAPAKKATKITLSADPEKVQDVKIEAPDMFTLDEINDACKAATKNIMQGVRQKQKSRAVDAFELILNLYGTELKAYLIKEKEGGEK